MRILSIDPGEKRIGLAISDSDGKFARPLQVIARVSYKIDAALIAQIATEQGAELILIGQSVDDEGQPAYIGRQSARLAEAIANQSTVPTILWDEAFSTQDARQIKVDLGVRRSRRRGHIDADAAAVILQSYLDAHQNK